MTPLYQWATRHAVTPQAVTELLAILGAGEPPTPRVTGLVSEAGVMQQRRVIAARRGGRMWRNNVGACTDDTGRMIRYGLGNDSSAVNARFKSSDLIGITPVTCRCGWRYGVFTAEECKAPGWKFRQTDERAVAQLNYIQLVVSLGGIARFITDPEEA